MRPYLSGESAFLANYSDGLTDLPLPVYIDHFLKRGKIGSFVAVKPTQCYHVVSADGDVVRSLTSLRKSDLLINGGFFAFRSEIFDYINDGEDLVEKPFDRLIQQEQLISYKYDGFWECMDTFKERQHLTDLYAQEIAPWEVWRAGRNGNGKVARDKRESARHSNRSTVVTT